MPSRNSSEASWAEVNNRLSSEDRQWVRDLSSHRGYSLVQASLKEMLVSHINRLRKERSAADFTHLQGVCDGLELALGIPSKLLEVPRPPGDR